MIIAITIFLILGILQNGFYIIRMAIEGMILENIIFLLFTLLAAFGICVDIIALIRLRTQKPSKKLCALVLVFGSLIGGILMCVLRGERKEKSLEESKKRHVNSGTFSGQSVADELKKFKELYDSGVISQQEFEEKKRQLLNL